MADYISDYTGAQVDANLAKAATAVQPATLSNYATTSALTSGLATKQDSLPSGNNDTYLHKNASTGSLEWSTVSAGGGTWGSITGTLSSQTDLQSALDAKQATISDLATIRTDAEDGELAYTTLNDATSTAGQALIADGTGSCSWQDIKADAIDTTGETDGTVLTADGQGGCSWEMIEIDETNIASENEDSGKVLTADGQGGCSWQYPSATNFSSTGATAGQVLTANSSGGAAWGNLPNNATFSLSGTTLTITNS